jgi:hypothetical protein
MAEEKRGGLERLSIGYIIIAFAVAILVGWTAGDWWLVIPVMLLLAGGFYVVLGFAIRPSEAMLRETRRNSSYYAFWGGTLGIIGSIWLLNRQYPGNGVLLVVLFIVWVGAVVMVLSFGRSRPVA